MNEKTSDRSMNVSNIIGITKIADKIDLKKLYVVLYNSSFEPEQFSGLVFRSEEPPGTLTIFSTGKVICSGAKGRGDVETIISNFVEKLKFQEIPVIDEPEIQIKNMVFTKTLGSKINLAKVALSFGLQNVDYEPEDFPGLVYKEEEPPATFMLFESGMLICTGSDSLEKAELAYSKLEKKLKEFEIL
jgi:transcription initiation factor TFIID TATA-box-binding protein